MGYNTLTKNFRNDLAELINNAIKDGLPVAVVQCSIDCVMPEIINLVEKACEQEEELDKQNSLEQALEDGQVIYEPKEVVEETSSGVLEGEIVNE